MRFIEKTDSKLSLSNSSVSGLSTSKMKASSYLLTYISFRCWLFLLQVN